MSREGIWKHKLTAVVGKGKLFGLDIFAFPWQDTGEIATVFDPLYGQEHPFPVYTVTVQGKPKTFAAGEFSHNVWGFYTK